MGAPEASPVHEKSVGSVCFGAGSRVRYGLGFVGCGAAESSRPESCISVFSLGRATSRRRAPSQVWMERVRMNASRFN